MSLFPQAHYSNIRIFYLLTMANNAFFLVGNWIFFWLRYMTYGQLGWIDATCFAFGMIMEIPTGAISDLVGKKKTLALAQFLAAAGFAIMASSVEKYQLLVGFLITQAGWAFYSGAAEALAYDTLKEKGQEEQFDHVISSSNVVSIASTVFCTLIGILLYEWYFRSTHFAMAVAYGIGFILTFFLTEPKVDSEHFSFKGYFNQLAQGFYQLLQPKLKRFLPLIATLLGVYFVYSFGFLKPAVAEHFGFLAREQGLIYAVLSLVSAVLVHFVPQMRKKLSDAQGLILLTLLLGIGFLLAGLLTGWFGGIFVITLIAVAGSLSSPWVSVVVNREIASKYRATTLSTISMITKVPYIIVAILAGKLIQDGLINQFNTGIGILTLGATLFSILLLRKHLAKQPAL